MDKSDLILEKLNSMEKALRTEIKAVEKALRAENKTLSDKIDELAENQDMFWQALIETRQDIAEIKNDLTDNSLKIKIIDNKVKAL
jgi:DNA-binding transcriptional MerR regulator